MDAQHRREARLIRGSEQQKQLLWTYAGALQISFSCLFLFFYQQTFLHILELISALQLLVLHPEGVEPACAYARSKQCNDIRLPPQCPHFSSIDDSGVTRVPIAIDQLRPFYLSDLTHKCKLATTTPPQGKCSACVAPGAIFCQEFHKLSCNCFWLSFNTQHIKGPN